MSKDVIARSDALHVRAVAFVRAFERGEPMPEPFDSLAADLGRFQAANIEGHARLCRARGVSPAGFARAADVPAVPTEAFKLTRVAAFAPNEARAVFRTSGTTTGARGTHEMRRPATYDAAALAFGRWALVPAAGSPLVLVLGPSPDEVPDSSLTHMLALFAERLGPDASPVRATRPPFFIQEGIIDLAALDERIAEAIVADRPVLLLATTLALVHLLDGLGEARLPLPGGSRVMQTGGFKGVTRTVEPAKLREDLARVFGVQRGAIVSEYGMTELSSQFYEATLRGGVEGVYAEPPWARVVPVDPETLEPVSEGAAGVARIEDLMNVDSAFAVLAADRVRRVAGGFELLGRAPGAPPRGCSIAVDEMLSGAR